MLPALHESPDLKFRKLRTDDQDWLYSILGDAATMLYYPRPYTQSEVDALIDRMLLSYEEHGFGLWALELQQEQKPIGQCGITMQDIDGDLVPEIGYHLHKDFQGQGLATRAARACLDFGLQQLRLPAIYIHTYIKNLPSIAIAERLNMEKVHEYDKAITSANRIMRHVVYRYLP